MSSEFSLSPSFNTIFLCAGFILGIWASSSFSSLLLNLYPGERRKYPEKSWSLLIALENLGADWNLRVLFHPESIMESTPPKLCEWEDGSDRFSSKIEGCGQKMEIWLLEAKHKCLLCLLSWRWTITPSVPVIHNIGCRLESSREIIF